MAEEPTTESPPKGKKSSGKFHGVPKPVLFAGVGIVAYLGYRWWKNKQSTSSTTAPSATTAGTTTGATDTSGSGLGGGYGGGYGGGQATTPTINPDTGLPYVPTTTIDPSTGLANTPPTAVIYPNEPAPSPSQVVPPGSTIPVKTTPTGLPALAAFGSANPTGVNAKTGANPAAAPKGSSKQVLGETVKNVS